MGYWAAIAMGAQSLLSSNAAAGAQAGANKTNVKLQRENQAWQKMMADSAVQRRVADIKAAGGNPATAFVNGGEASSPVTQPATVEPVNNMPNFTAAFMSALQAKQMQAQTRDTTASARLKEVEANINESLMENKREYKANEFLEKAAQQDLQTKIMRHMDAKTGAEAKLAEGTVNSLIQEAAQQAERGKIDLAALRNIANIAGVEAGKMSGVIKLILDFWRTMNMRSK